MTASIVGVVIVCAVLGFVIVSSVMPSQRGSASKASAASDGPARPGTRDNEDHRNAGSKSESDWREPIPAGWEKVLGVTHSATAAEVRKAYLILVQQYHPDRFTSAAPEIAEYGAEKTRLLTLHILPLAGSGAREPPRAMVGCALVSKWVHGLNRAGRSGKRIAIAIDRLLTLN